jgi:hypothetical protein
MHPPWACSNKTPDNAGPGFQERGNGTGVQDPGRIGQDAIGASAQSISKV